MSTKYFDAQEFDYYFKSAPTELSVYDSLAWADMFGHTVEGQGGIVLRTLTEQVRKLNREIYARQVQDAADIAQKPAANRNRDFTDYQSIGGSIPAFGITYQGTNQAEGS